MAFPTRVRAALGPDTFVKALKADRTHHGYTYVLGRNECPQPFNDKECADGGLYACRLKDLFLWCSLYPDIDTVALVEIPDDAQRVTYATKTKASALVLTRFLPLIEAMELAVDNGADVHARDDEALHRASGNGHLAVVEFLVAHGADVHAYDDLSLRFASDNSHLSVVQFLVAHGADVHANNDEALHRASYNGHLAVVQFLVAHGANVHAENDQALRWASNYGHLDVVEFLKSLP